MTRITSFTLAGALVGFSGIAAAQEAAPRVVADILPVQGLVAQVMDGIAEPRVIMGPDAEPHSHRLRPSEAAALQDAELVVWIGETMSPPFTRARAQLAASVPHIELIALEGSEVLEMRVSAMNDGHDHGGHDDHGEEGHDDHGHKDHDDHGEEGHEDHGHKDHDDHGDEGHDDHGHKDHDDHSDEGHDDHGHEDAHDDHGHEDKHAEHGKDEHGHDHAEGAADPHAWLDPANARGWLTVIADELAALDPARADAYRANARSGAEAITAAEADVAAAVGTLGDRVILASHDAYQYIEAHFGLEIVGSVQSAQGDSPSAKRLQEVQSAVGAHPGVCVLSDPAVPARQVGSVLGNVPHRVVTIDPLGRAIAPGASFYPELMRSVAKALAECAKPL